MKKLTKIKLINWHLFSNQTIDIKDNALISGENGSGKSTLLDAMQYLLVGGRSGAKFNIAATDDAKRTLEGYIKGRIGAENKEYLRNGDVITHLALEYFDEQSKQYSTMGVVLELPKSGNLKERFYLLDNISIHDSLFLDKKYPRDYKSMKAYLKTLDMDFSPFESQRKYREALARFFGMDATKYAKILPKALAFRSIDLQQFVFEFLLDDDPIDIQSLKNNVAQLKKIEQQIKNDRDKLTQLTLINEKGEDIEQNIRQKDINNLIDQLNWVEKREEFIKENENRLTNINKQLDYLRDAKSQLDDQMDENDTSILNLERAKNDNDISRTLQSYQDALNKKALEYEKQKENVLQVKQDLQREFNVMKELANLMPNQSIKQFVQYYQQSMDQLDTEELNNHLSTLEQDVKSLVQAYTLEKDKLEKNKQDLSSSISQSKANLHQLKKHVKTYPYYVQKLITSLNDELSNYYQKEVNVQPLCEMIEVNDEKWRNALEGYLGGQRFDIIVDPKYFNDALEIYDRIKFDQKIYGVGLVNTQKIQHYDQINENTLASKITSEHKYARYYVNMMLNNIMCVDDVKELKNYQRAITSTCMTYSNYTARQINPRNYEVPFIGQSATAIQTEMEERTLAGLEEQMQALYNLTDKNDHILKLLLQSRNAQLLHQGQIRYLDLIKLTRKEYTTIEDQILALGKSKTLQNIEEQIEKAKLARKELRFESDELVGKIATQREERQRVLDRIDDVQMKLDEFVQEQKVLAQKHPEKLSIANTQFYALKQKYKQDHDSITNYLANSSVSLNSQIIKDKTELANVMKNYNETYHFGAAATLEELVYYEQEANKIRNNNLVKYEQEATELRRSSETGFKEEFVGKLRASIENAQQQIAELNYALQDKRFGSDSYQLTYKASTDPDYKMYYDIIMSNQAISKHTLFTEGLTKKNEAALMELFEKIASNDPEYDTLTYKFLDYRNYMSYDIEVTNINGNKSMFSKVSKEKSGGETQVPFYIVIAASFQQLLTKNRRIDSGCIVLFDEAFNNMDESRIDAMMKFYNSLSIQLLIAVPPQRVSNIINYVNTSLVIVKDNDYAIVETFNDERQIRM
ncbi:ATP-binding protein [Mariniplasma anaerobium]|uniref:ATPase n=1 Tax=Mariniplasma anaerobium TaxID=2735436 RepID=A0A7U9TJM1_9MOLU|nr:SbcC/MukB-like Walker B domain-containing protein [Mariniplasma anaerobium]BCR36326.1 ATPase [Mariniplasma anaerobium]